MIKKTYLAASIALLSGSVLVGCSGDDQANAASMLNYIPANSPYFMATRESVSEQEAFDFYQRTQVFRSFQQDLEELRDAERELKELREREGDARYEQYAALLALVRALGEEFESIDSLDELHARGLRASPHMSLYGLGILPVMRVELEDESAFRDTLERVLARAELAPRTGRFDETDYWVLTPEGDVEIILTIVDHQALLALMPANASDELMTQVLGQELPEETLADTGELAEIESRYGFTPYGAGQVSTARVFDELGSPSHAGTRALLASTGEAPPDFSSCQADIDRLTRRLPGLAVGTREYDLMGRSEVNLIVQTDDDLVADLRRLSNPVAGMGRQQGLASAGLSINLPVLLELVQTYSRQLRDNPFSCAELSGLNSMWSDANGLLSNPLVMMVAPSLSGLNARIDRLYVKNAEPVINGLLTLGSANPMALLQAASAFVPELGQLGLTPNSAPQRVKSMMLPPSTPELYAAMSESALALGFGLDAPSALEEGLNAPVVDEDLLLHGFFTGEFFQALADIAETDNGELARSEIDNLRRQGEIYDNMELTIKAGEYGLEVNLAAELNDQ
ncbi:hypothetical protein ACGK9R_03975 [Halomonas sp. HNIBRBA4712]|uniref:hypothetical protein n=1 Tax=Halomonas sp. HNIBRBA4712 TaxID=3373087 RepID=UPI0037452A61